MVTWFAHSVVLRKIIQIDTTGFWFVGWAFEQPGLVEGGATHAEGLEPDDL